MAGRVPPQGARSDLAITTPFGKSDAVGDALELKAFDLETGGGGPSYRAMLRLSGEATLTKPFLQNPFVYACVMAIARAASTVPLRLYRRDSNDNAQDAVVRNHKLFSLLERPNPLLSQKKLWRTQAVYHCLYGETFWIMLKRVSARGRMLVRPVNLGEIPDEIWPVRGDLVEPVIDENTKLPVAWRLSVGSQAVDYPDHAVAQFAEVDPYNPMRGVGPMQAAFRTATKDFTCDRYDDALLKNGGSPGGVLSSTQPLTEQQLSVIRNSWNEGQGRTEEHRKTAVIPFGMEYKQFGFSPADMEFKDLRSWNRETIMSVFGVTRPILGLTEGLNYASAREAFRVFWEVTVCPYLEFQADEFNSKVLAKFEPQESGLYAAFDTSNVASLRETIDSKIDRTMKLFQQCGRSFDEAARLAGWQIPPTTMGDRMFVPASMAPLPEEKAMYDAQLLAARAAGAQQVPDAPAPAAKDVSPADIIRAIEVVDGEPTTATEANTRRLAEHAALIDEHAPKIAKRAKRVMRDYLLASRAKLRSVAGSQLEANSDVQKIILTEQEVEDLLQMNEDNWRKEMRDALEKPMHAAWDAAAKAAFIKIASDGLFMSSSDPVALQFLNDHLVQLSEGTMSTLAIQVRRTIIKVLASAPDDAVRLQDAIRLTLRELEDQVEVMIDNLDARADLIAQTEANAMANAASAMQWRELGIETHTWLTAGDERVRHSHQELNGKTVRIGDVFGYNLRWPGDPQASVEQVVNCFVPGTHVEGRFVGGLKAFYAGPVWSIETTRGHRLTVTPNHPILTDRGWIPAAQLRKGDSLVSSRSNVKDRLLRNPNDQQRPSLVKDVFNTLLASGASRSVVVHALDLHGDAQLCDGNVQVVRSNGILTIDHSALGQGVREFRDESAPELEVVESRDSSLDKLGMASHLAPRGGPSIPALSFNQRPVALEGGPLDPLGFGSSSWLDATPKKKSPYGGAAHSKFLGELILRGSGEVAVDRVARISVDNFCGHVYDLQTTSGWILASGIVSSNCRCTTLAEPNQ